MSNKIILLVLSAVIVVSSILCISFYNAGYANGQNDTRCAFRVCDSESYERLEHFRAMGLEPDSAIWCKDCHEVHLFFPGFDYGDEKQQMQPLTLSFRAYDALRVD